MKEKKVTSHFEDVKDIYHLVLNNYNENGKRKTHSIKTKLPIRENKKQANAMLKYLIDAFEIPTGDKKSKSKRIRLYKDMLFSDFMVY